ncbi:MAG TPA: ABC transporter permease subunit [Verrucomicrobiae bacterium]
MILGPVIDRELRLRARSRTTYWLRMATALIGLLFCFQQLLVTAVMRSPAALGRNVFNGIVAAAFLVGASACVLTADSISAERRDGTLGLLFLTGVNGREVITGKLLSAGLTSLIGMLAFLPALVLPLLAGGIGGDEIVRKGAALMATLWFALGAGLFGSALERNRAKAVRSALLLTAAFLLLPLLPFLASSGGIFQYLGLLSPVALTMAAGQSLFATSPHLFWISLAAVQTVGWVLVTGAGLLLHRAVLLDSSRVIERPAAAAEETKKQVGFGRWRPDREDSDPVEWLVFRGKGVSALLWLGGVGGLVVSRSLALILPFFGARGTPRLWLMAWPVGVGTALLGGALVALVATRFFARARQTGELELLLTSPVGAKTLVSDQWRVLSRVFVWPALGLQAAVLLPLACLGGLELSSMSDIVVVTLSLNLVNTGLGTAALCWAGMRYGLKARTPALAILSTVALAEGVPWLILMGTGMVPIVPDLVLLGFYGFLILSSRDRVHAILAEGEPTAVTPVEGVRL